MCLLTGDAEVTQLCGEGGGSSGEGSIIKLLLQQAGNHPVVTGFTLTDVEMQFQTALTDFTAFSPVTPLSSLPPLHMKVSQVIL